MRNIENVITEYLSKQTDFAVQIVGNWGYGKTYYYRNNLVPLINKTETFKNANKKYKPVYISLFGLKSVEEIATKIVLEFYQSKIFGKYFSSNPFKKRLRVTQSLLKIGIRGFLSFKRLGSVNDYLTDVQSIAENVLDTSELIVCFDDLERKAKSFNIEDLIGYINSLVDEGVKVLIISNDDLLLKEGDVYKNLKEKVIGINVEFLPDTKNILESIIKTRYQGFQVYSTFLNENIDELVAVSVAAKNNFRHIIYALDCLQNFYSKVKNDIIDCKNDIAKKLQVELKSISKILVSWAIEYKSSELKHTDISDYSSDSLFLYEVFSENIDNTSKTDSKDKAKVKLFFEKYGIDRNDYFLHESIFKYVTASDEFNVEFFITEFTKRFNLGQGKTLLQYEILDSLHYKNYLELSGEQYKMNTLSMIEYAEKGFFTPVDYLTVMHFSERFDNILNLNLEDVRDKLIAGLKKAFADNPEASKFLKVEFEMSGASDEISENNKGIYQAGLEEFKKNEDLQQKEEYKKISDLLINDTEEFRRKYDSDPNFQTTASYYSFLADVNINEFAEKIKRGDNSSITYIKIFLEKRYKNVEKLKSEIHSISALKDSLLNYKNELTNNDTDILRKYVFDEFYEFLTKIVEPKSGLLE